MGSGDLLHLSSNALRAYQSKISVYGQNIANVDLKGYSRRELEVEVALDGRGNGIGIQTGDTIRSFNAISAATLIREDSVLSFHKETGKLLKELEILTGGSSGGFPTALQDFEDAWKRVAASPEDPAARTILIQKGSSLATEFNQLNLRYSDFSEALVSVSNPDTGLIANSVDEINNLTSRLQALNVNIHNADHAGHGVPALRDERDQLVRQLAKNANITVTPDYRITLGGQELLSSDGASRQELQHPTASTFEVAGVDITDKITSGTLAAQVGAYASVSSLKNQLDTVATTLTQQVNQLFDSAYNLNGESPAEKGYTFFKGSGAADISIDKALFDPANPMSANPALIAAAATRASDGPPPKPNSGDNGIAQKISQLFDKKLDALGSRNPAEYWSDAESLLAGSVAESDDMADTSQKLINLLDQRMQSQAGVNLDEELVHLMSAQRAYEACSRVFSTANKLLEVLMNV